MNFFKKKEHKIIKKFLKEGYIIGNVEDKKSIKYIRDLVTNYLKSINSVRKKINLNDFHK